jgi:hypothetical protein
MSDRETEEAGLLAEIAERDAFEARFPPEAFEPIARALNVPPTPENISAIRGWLMPYLEQRDVMAGGATDLHKVSLPEILDPCRVEGKHSRALLLPVCSTKADGQAASRVDVAIRFQARGDGRGARGPQLAPKPSRFHASRQPALRSPSSMWA